METTTLLKTVNHIVFAPRAIAAIGPEKCLPQDGNTSLLTAEIDFEQGLFRLEGDMHFIMACNKHAEPEWFSCHNQRVIIKAGISPGCSINLLDENNDGAVFMMQGNVKDNDTNTACKGLLVLDKTAAKNELGIETWHISFYLYDSNDDGEIAIKIPVLVYPSNVRMN